MQKPLAWTFVLVGPGIISGPYEDADYVGVAVLIDDLHEALGLPWNKQGDWSICWRAA